MSWRDFWNGEHAIYVSDRHRLLHYDRIAKDIAGLIGAAGANVLDYACGEARAAGLVAAKCDTLYLYDQAPNVQVKLRLKFSRNPRIQVLSTQALDLVPDASLDLIVVNSLLQYISHAEFEQLLEFWHAKLKADGRLVLADVIAPDVSAVTDAIALVNFGWQGGFLFAAIAGLITTFFSNYRKLRQELGLTRYSQQSATVLLAAHGFTCERAARNLGHNQARLCLIAKLAPET